MTIGTFQAYYTLTLFVIMIGIIGWAYSKRNRSSFDEAADLVFADESERTDKE
ncbi:cbb3-type cytochrome c oxidase subunit 3 [Ferrimonas lipolytica]|uniref:Cbb3-type cytochrome c oxidase subunit 3 n=2 Tax=Ferrimonas lipolytica TaxID=2724191 RepID=A0A6H1UKT1_9GAMM|nr:cbb3-type cytochrome c oxidase subunit 3 [Ferrimonas lipolytica]QIZ78836.1 cbb3-type cytochrome c oxidase subunit 3 [Ferrimonas lipolytica]